MVAVPTPTIVTVSPKIVATFTLSLANVTVSPDEAVATRSNAASP